MSELPSDPVVPKEDSSTPSLHAQAMQQEVDRAALSDHALRLTMLEQRFERFEKSFSSLLGDLEQWRAIWKERWRKLRSLVDDEGSSKEG